MIIALYLPLLIPHYDTIRHSAFKLKAQFLWHNNLFFALFLMVITFFKTDQRTILEYLPAQCFREMPCTGDCENKSQHLQLLLTLQSLLLLRMMMMIMMMMMMMMMIMMVMMMMTTTKKTTTTTTTTTMMITLFIALNHVKRMRLP